MGIESTVLDLTTRPVRILRPGMISSQSLRAALIKEGEASATVVSAKKPGVEDLLRSPGQLPRHYAPKARLAVWEWQTEADLKAQILKLKFPLAKVQVIAHTQIPGGQGFGRVRVLPHNPAAFGRALYAEMHRCDEEGAELIVVEALPEGAAWAALRDRLQRAASSAV